MTEKESVDRDLGLTFDFIDYLIKNPAEIERLPAKFVVVFVEQGAPRVESPKRKLYEPETERVFVDVKRTFSF
jgi:hypothetical protein